MTAHNDVMRSDRLKQVMQEIDPTFDEKDAGFSRFSKFVVEAAHKGLIHLTKLDNGQYEIALGAGVPGAAAQPAFPGVEAPRESDDRSQRGGSRRRSEDGRTRRGGAAEMIDLPEADDEAFAVAVGGGGRAGPAPRARGGARGGGARGIGRRRPPRRCRPRRRRRRCARRSRRRAEASRRGAPGSAAAPAGDIAPRPRRFSRSAWWRWTRTSSRASSWSRRVRPPLSPPPQGRIPPGPRRRRIGVSALAAEEGREGAVGVVVAAAGGGAREAT